MAIIPFIDYSFNIRPVLDARDDLQKNEDNEKINKIRDVGRDIVLVLAKGPDENGKFNL